MEKNALINEVLEDSEVKEFCTKYKLQKKDIINNLNKFYQFIDAKQICEKCIKAQHKNCLNDELYLQVGLQLYNDAVDTYYKECPKKQPQKNGSLEHLHFTIPSNEEVYINEKRSKLITMLDKCLTNIREKKSYKGLYVYGKFGCGKTFILYRFAQKLSRLGYNVIFTYYPDLIRIMKSSIGDNKLESNIQKLKTADIIFLDDFGGEVNTAFARDEILGPILQYRIDNHLPVFFTSNYDFNTLHEHLSETSQKVENIKADRIVERIHYLAEVVKLDDIDYRNKRNS